MNLDFFNRTADEVAADLIGMTLVRKCGTTLRGRIVETEAYLGSDDPGSRAKHGRRPYNAPMFDGAGNLFVYNVHMYWMLNITTKPVSAVLIRAVEPLNFEGNPSGPGRLTRTLKIDRSFHNLPVGEPSGIWIEDGRRPSRIARSFRIGLREDMTEPMRFFDPDSEWVSASKKPEGFMQ